MIPYTSKETHRDSTVYKGHQNAVCPTSFARCL
jgi:hypothetical protein